MIFQSWYRSDHLAEVVFVRFLRSKVILYYYCYYYYHYYFKFFIIYFVEGSYYVYSTHKSGKLCSWTWVWNVCTNCLKIFYMGEFSSLWVCLFASFSKMFFIYLREWGEIKHERERQREREKQVLCWTGSLPWDLDHDTSLRQKLKWLSNPGATLCFFLFF